MVHIHNIMSTPLYIFVVIISIIMIFPLPKYLQLGASKKAIAFSKFIGYFYIAAFTIMLIISFIY